MEFAFLAPILFVGMLGLIDLGWLSYVHISVHQSVMLAGRQAIRSKQDDLNPQPGPLYTATQIRQMVIDGVRPVTLTAPEVTVTFRSGDTDPPTTFTTIEIAVQHAHEFFAPGLWTDTGSTIVTSRIKGIVVEGLQ